jgi:hypothetical protein
VEQQQQRRRLVEEELQQATAAAAAAAGFDTMCCMSTEGSVSWVVWGVEHCHVIMAVSIAAMIVWCGCVLVYD